MADRGADRAFTGYNQLRDKVMQGNEVIGRTAGRLVGLPLLKMRFRYLYIDSRYRTLGAGSDFSNNLNETIELEEGARCWVTGVNFPNVFYTLVEDGWEGDACHPAARALLELYRFVQLDGENGVATQRSVARVDVKVSDTQLFTSAPRGARPLAQ